MSAKKKKLLAYGIVGAVFYLIVCFWVLHFSIIQKYNPRSSIDELLILATDHLFTYPLEIFPISMDAIKWLIVGTLAIGTLAFMSYSTHQMKKHDNPDTVNGSAHFMDDKEKKEYNLKFSDPQKSTKNNGPYNMLLAQEIAFNMDNRATRRNCNILVIGGSGAGKSRFFVGPNVLQANCNFIITDPSGELLNDYGKFLENNGYTVKVFNLVDVYKSSRYNPFNYIRSEKDVFILVNTLIKNTTPEGKGGGDPFWENSEKALLSALILYLWSQRPKEEQTFESVMKLLYMADINENDDTSKSPLDTLFEDLESRDPENLAIHQYKIFKMGAGKTLKSILISVGVRLNPFNLKDVKYLTSTDDLELEKFADKRQALFVIIPTAENTFNFLVSLMYSQLFMSLYDYVETRSSFGYQIVLPNRDVVRVEQAYSKEDSAIAKEKIDAFYNTLSGNLSIVKNEYKNYYEIRNCNDEIVSWRGTEEKAKEYINSLKYAKVKKVARKLPIHCRMLLDEFANIGQIPDFNEKLATIRKYELSCAIILQALSQIKGMYEKQWETIVGNCDVKLYLGGNDFGTVEWLSKSLGKRTTVVENTSWQSGNNSGSTSYNRSSIELMAPDKILEIDDDECILMMRPYKYFGKKYDIEKHPNYKEAMSTAGTFVITTSTDNNEKKSSVQKNNTNANTNTDTTQKIDNAPLTESAGYKEKRNIKNERRRQDAKDALANIDSSNDLPVVSNPSPISEDTISQAFNCENTNEFAAITESFDSHVILDESSFGIEEMYFESTE